MKLSQLAKSLLALTAAGLTLQYGTGCDEKDKAPAPAAKDAPSATGTRAEQPASAPASADTAVSTTFVKTADGGAARLVEMAVTGEGYVPDKLTAVKGQPLLLRITRKTENTCAVDLLIEDTDIKVELPLNQPVEVVWTPTKTGEIKFGCSMDKMISGVLLVEEA